MGSVGNACTDRSGYAAYTSTDTWIFSHACSDTGRITSWCIYKENAGTGTLKLKIFRDDGTNFVFVGESSSETISQGLNTFSANISVVAGDLIALYHSGFNIDSNFGSTEVWHKSGDITSNSVKSGWTYGFGYGTDSFGATITANVDVYVDINKANDTGDGLSWANAKKTMNAGYTMLNSTGTLHVASGDYSAQSGITYNKSWSLSPEDPNAVGYKSVSIPQGL